MRILIVDDSLTNRLLLRAMLEDAGFDELVTADSAKEAFDILGISVGEPNPRIDLILMDIIMPGIDGIQACQRIKDEELLKDIPIIMVTGRTQMEDLERAFGAGATDYVTKPVNKIELLARARSALRLKHETDCRKQREKELLEVTLLLEKANKQLQRLSSLDGLTEIANRREFEEILTLEWKRSARENTSLSLILVDIDHFKPYNDTFGHRAGDQTLIRVAQTLQNSLKRSGDVVARYGGEEFAVILPNTPEAGAIVVAEKLRQNVEGLCIPHPTSSVAPYVSISVGVATMIPSQFFSPALLVNVADRALYRAKDEGRNRVAAAQMDSLKYSAGRETIANG